MKFFVIGLVMLSVSAFGQSSLQQRMQMESESISLSQDVCHYTLLGSDKESESQLAERVSRKECYALARKSLEQSAVIFRKVIVKHSGKWEMFYREKMK